MSAAGARGRAGPNPRRAETRPMKLSPVPFLSVLLVAGATSSTLAANPGLGSTALDVPAAGRTGFSLLAPDQTGIQFVNRLDQARFTTNQICLNGSGVAAGDVDGDGRCDLYFTSLSGSNALYRNLGGMRFTNITASAGAGCPELSATACAFADLNGDGHLDLIVNSIGSGTHLFINNGKG